MSFVESVAGSFPARRAPDESAARIMSLPPLQSHGWGGAVVRPFAVLQQEVEVLVLAHQQQVAEALAVQVLRGGQGGLAGDQQVRKRQFDGGRQRDGGGAAVGGGGRAEADAGAIYDASGWTFLLPRQSEISVDTMAGMQRRPLTRMARPNGTPDMPPAGVSRASAMVRARAESENQNPIAHKP